MSSLSSLNNQMLRLTGLSSGLDTESIVRDMMKLEQLKVDAKDQSKQKLEWKKSSFEDMLKSIRTFRNDYFTAQNPSKSMYTVNALNLFSATLSTGSEGKFKVSTGINSQEFSYSLIKAEMATAARATSSELGTDGDRLNLDKKLEDLQTDEFFGQNAILSADGKLSFSINGKSFEFEGSATMRQVMNTINSDSDIGVKMTYSSLSYSFSLTSKTTGENAKIELENGANGTAFGAGGVFGMAEATGTGAHKGQNGKLTISDGTGTRTIESSTNSFSIDGTTFTILEAFDETSGTPYTANIARDTDAVVDKIKGFIDGFNTMLEAFINKIYEEKFKEYPPLTDEQRDAMSEKEIEKWEEKAKSGLFRNDRDLLSLTNELRRAFSEPMAHLGGASLSSIGISFGSYFSSDKNKVVVDEEKLRAAFEQNPDMVSKMFNNPDDAEAESSFGMSGLVQRLNTTMTNYTKKLNEVHIYNTDKQIKDVKEAIEKLQTRMVNKEAALWKQFTAMETAMAKLNSQSSWLTQQFSS